MYNAIQTYLLTVQKEYETGIAAEHAYRPALEILLEAAEIDLNAVNDPKRIDIGAPDFQILRGQTTIGFVEAKDINVSLDRELKKEQIQRYLSGLGNLILTNYLEFRWYVKGQHQQTVQIARLNGKIQADTTQHENLAHLLHSFTQVVVPTINSARELAQRMAANAHLIRDLIFRDLESNDPSPSLAAQKEAFARTLLPDIDNAQFADMYAQTIAYGMFAARVNYTGQPELFSRRGAGEDIPRTNPFLRKLFINIGLDLGDRITFLVDVLADLLAHTDIGEILKDFGKATRQEDPVVHFYETFLSEYDPRERELRGVYYTPEPIVSYIVRSIDQVLVEHFGRQDGLADTETLILDPATGTGTFLYFVMRRIYDSYFTGQVGIWNSYVNIHLLRRIFGFEILMAPYAIAHMKLGLLLNDLGYTFGSNQRLGVYLTNTLEEANTNSEILFAQYISEEANEAAAIKRDKPIMVVLGNPPYSNFGHLNRGSWILDLLEDYKKGLKEKKLNLDDDYIKFIRFGQWRIEQTGQGILALVTNHSYLSGVTHRRMRESLRETFSDIYVLDLHGNSRMKEYPPNELDDKPVFDIQQGVAISIFVKLPNKSSPATIHHAELWGSRNEKYDWLLTHDLQDTPWQTLENVDIQTCLGRFYFFAPKSYANIDEYCVAWSIEDIFPVHQNAIKTDRDTLVYDFDREELSTRIEIFYSSEGVKSPFKQAYNVSNSSGYDLLSKRRKTTFDESYLSLSLYRPFDERWLYYNPDLISRSAFEVMQHMVNSENLALIATRQTRDKWCVLATGKLAGHKSMAAYDINSLFPLYLYPSTNGGKLFTISDDGSVWDLSEQGRRPNMNPKFVDAITRKLSLNFLTDGKGDLQTTLGPEDIYSYAYAVFHSPTYRLRYAEFLEIDFPRLPLTSNLTLFRLLVTLGNQLVNLHLMKSPIYSKLITTYPKDGNNVVLSNYPKYTDTEQRVWLNKEQYFEGIPQDVWEFHIGGYQVLEKWLKDRRERVLTYDEIMHYQRIVISLKETIRLMNKIDETIPAFPIN